jgi:transcription termination factor Rho
MSEDPSNPENSLSFSVSAERPTPVGPADRPGGDGQQRPHRRRRRRRRRGGGGGGGGRPGGFSGNGGAPERVDELTAAGPERPVEGVLYLPAKETAPGVLVSSPRNYLPTPSDPLVPRELIAREGLEAGALIAGFAADGTRPVVRRVETGEGLTPAEFRQRPQYGDLVSIDPNPWLKLETEPDEM